MDWRIKAAVSRVLSCVPCQTTVRLLIQRRCVTAHQRWPVERTLSFGRTLVRACRECGFSLDGKDAVEIGTGWVPLIPVFFWLCGARSCRTYDLDRLLSEDWTAKALGDAVQYLTMQRWEEVAAGRLELLASVLDRRSIGPVLELCAVEYHAPADASKTGLPPGSADVVFSNNVLEHVAPDAIVPLLAEARRILRPGGVTAHVVDLSDHYSHSDPSLPRVNFLKYSDWQFRWINNRWIYQNRLRPCHYRQMLDEVGLRVLKWDVRIDENSLRHVRKMKLAQRFRELPQEELCADALVFVAG